MFIIQLLINFGQKGVNIKKICPAQEISNRINILLKLLQSALFYSISLKKRAAEPKLVNIP